MKAYKKKDGSSVVKGDNGKIVRNLPATNSLPNPIPTIPAKATLQSEPPRLTYEEMQAQREKLAEQRAVTREIMANFTDEIEDKFPKAFYMGLDDNYRPVSLEDSKGNVVEVLTEDKYPDLFDTFSSQREAIQASFDAGWRFKDKTPQAPGATQAGFLSFRCKESDTCTFRSPRYGFAPRHTASEFCSSGRRNHCTCDTCF